MKAHLVTTLSLLLCGAALGLPFGCAADVGAPATGDDTATESAAMNPAYTNHYYRVWKQCSLEPCSYHFVREVNATDAYVWVSGLTFDGPGFDARTQRAILEAPWEELILYGTFATPGRTEDAGPFVIRQAFRGMPGIPANWDDQFYVVRSIQPPILDFAVETELGPPPITQQELALRTGPVVSEPGQSSCPRRRSSSSAWGTSPTGLAARIRSASTRSRWRAWSRPGPTRPGWPIARSTGARWSPATSARP